jgi:hypothetical protein
MRFINDRNANFSRVLEPQKEKIISAEQVANLTPREIENVARIEFTPPKIGGNDFGKFKVTYKTPVLCEVPR